MKYLELINPNDPKIKHATGEYINLNNFPQPDDIVYYIASKGKKLTMTHSDIVTFFTDTEILRESLRYLRDNDFISIRSVDGVDTFDPDNTDDIDFVYSLK